MRFLLAIAGLWHAWRAGRHYRAYLHHVGRRAALPVRTVAERQYASPSPAGRILLASITGMAICATWIAFAWRAMS